jgi:hypothetical protein
MSEAVVGFLLGLILVFVLSLSYTLGASGVEIDVKKSCKLTGTFVVRGTAYTCEEKHGQHSKV